MWEIFDMGAYSSCRIFAFQACAKRIAVSKEGDCEPWYFDYLKCLDNCVSN
jgi:hypothetical protein